MSVFDCVKRKYDDALARRRALLEGFGQGTDCYRLIHSDADGFSGVTVDRLGPVLLVETHIGAAVIDSLVEVLRLTHGRDTPIFLKEKRSLSESARKGVQISGPPQSPDIVVHELGLSFEVHLTASVHVGVFLDSRSARRAVREISGGKRMLNLFSYTGGFGMAAAAGGALSTTNIDSKRSALAAAAENYKRNGLAWDSRTFLKSDAVEFLKRCIKNKRWYDVVVLDPPPISKRTNRDVLDTTRSFGRLVCLSAGAVEDGGALLVGLNNKNVDDCMFIEMVEKGMQDAYRRVAGWEVIAPDTDFPPQSERPTARFLYLRDIRRSELS